MALTQTQVSQLYVATFGRASEGEGNAYWQENGETMSSTAEAMINSPAGQAYFGETLNDNQAFIEFIYNNTLGKTYEDDPEGVDFWVGQLESGRSKGEVVADLVWAASEATAPDEDAQRAQDQFNNKVQVSNYTADNIETATLEDLDIFAGYINGVDHTAASVDAAEKSVYKAANLNLELSVESAAGADVMRLTGDQDIRIDLTANDNQVKGLDLDGDGVIEYDGVENNDPMIQDDGQDFEIVNAYSKNPLDHTDTENNFLGDIAFDGTGFAGDGVNTDGNIFLGGLGADSAAGGIGNDFMAGGGVADPVRPFDVNENGIIEPGEVTTAEDYLFGGRNADFFFVDLSVLDFASGDNLDIDGGETADDTAAGMTESLQDTDWLLIEASDDDEPVRIDLGSATEAGTISTEFRQNDGGDIDQGDADDAIDVENIENVDASGNLYGFLDDIDVALGENGQMVGDENVGIGSSAQLIILGNESVNRIIGGFDNDHIEGGAGNDLLFGGRLDYNNNPNLVDIVNDGMDEIFGDAGDDDIVFEVDGGTISGGDDTDTLWITELALGTKSITDLTSDGTLRFDLIGEDANDTDQIHDGYNGYGGTDLVDSEDRTNYLDADDRVAIDSMENVIATGLGNVDYLASGANDPELNFNNQQNIEGYNGNLDLRGTDGTNILYAGGGNDVIEGRESGTLMFDNAGNVISTGDLRDRLSGGNGNDTFIFGTGDNNGDGVDVIHRQSDNVNNATGEAGADNIWDVDEDGNVLYEQDFDAESSVSSSNSTFTLGLPSTLAPYVDGVEFELGGNTYQVTGLTADDFATWLDNLETAIEANENLSTVSVSSTVDGVAVLTDSAGQEFVELADGWLLTSGSLPSDGLDQWYQQAGDPIVTESQDKLVYASYEDRTDGELRDDDAELGSNISLGADSYAEDLVISFDEDGTRIAEDQRYELEFTNLTTEDVVTITINGVDYRLQVGVDVDGNSIAAEDQAVNDDQADIQAAFLQRLVGFINTFMDDDTAAGQVDATYVDGQTISLIQDTYDGEQTVFMSTPTVALENLSGGEGASCTVVNNSDHEVHLLDFDGSDNELNSENVLFIGNQNISRATLETADDDPASGDFTIVGSEAVLIDNRTDSHEATVDNTGAAIADNQATNDILDNAVEIYSVHGDDLLIGGDADDTISGGTGDDRVIGSLGDDTIDGGKNFYSVQVLGEDKARVFELNNWEAQQENWDEVAALDGLTISSVTLIDQTESQSVIVAGSGRFGDTLQFEQADFQAGETNFKITLNDFSIEDGVVNTENDGAGTVETDLDGDGVYETEMTTFTNFENIRTVSGVGRAVADAGQGNDVLDVAALSTATGGISYRLTGEDNDPFAGNVDYSKDSANNVAAFEAGEKAGEKTGATITSVKTAILDENTTVAFAAKVNAIDTTDMTVDEFLAAVSEIPELLRPTSETDASTIVNVSDYETTVIRVDGVEHVIAGDGNDLLVIDETEAAKDNTFSASEGVDRVEYRNQYVANDPALAEPVVTIAVNVEDDVDVVSMTSGRVGSTVAEDTLNDVEYITLAANTARSLSESDVLDVTAMEAGAVVDYTNGEIREGSALAGNNVELVVENITELENVWADGDDTVIIDDDMANAREDSANGTAAKDILLATYLDFDDLTDEGARQKFGAEPLDIEHALNQKQFTFELSKTGSGDDNDIVDYKAETGNITAVANFDANVEKQYILVDHNGNENLTNAGDRVDELVGVENVVASKGDSILDLTNATQDLHVVFSADYNESTDYNANYDEGTGLEVHRVSVLGATVDGASLLETNYLDYVFVDTDDEDNIDVNENDSVFWNRLEGSDFDETVDLSGYQAAENHTLNLRGGDNRVNYEGDKVEIFIDIDEFDGTNETTARNSGKVEVTAIHTAPGNEHDENQADDEANVALDFITSYTADNEIAQGTLTIKGARYDEDAIRFANNLGNKVVLLDSVIDATSAITVTIDNGVEDDSLFLVGFERFYDADTDDVYELTEFGNLGNLRLIDQYAGDRDTLVAYDDAESEDGDSDGNVIDMAGIETELFGFDFDVLDLTNLTKKDATVNGDAGETVEIQEIIVGDFATIDSEAGAGISDFDKLSLTDGADGTFFDLDIDAGELQSASDSRFFDFDGNQIDASRMTSGVEITVTDTAGVGAKVVGSAQDDTITGGTGVDIITGGAGDDTMDGGIATEVRTFNILGIEDGAADDLTITFDNGAGGALAIVLEDGVDFTNGAGNDEIGAAIAKVLNGDLAATNAAFAEGRNPAAPITSVTYDNSTDLLSFTFATGYDVTEAISLTVAGSQDTFRISSENDKNADGGTGGDDTFVLGATAAANGLDTIENFAAGDMIAVKDFSDNVIVIDNGGDKLTAKDLAAMAFGLDADGNAVIVEYEFNDENDDDDVINVWYVDGSKDGVVTEDDVAKVAVINATADDFNFNASNINLDPGNSAPVAQDDVFAVAGDQAISLNVLANDQDAETTNLSITSVAAIDPAIGSVAIVDNEIVFTPVAGVNQVVTFDYTVSDGTLTDMGMVTVTVGTPDVTDPSLVSSTPDGTVDVAVNADIVLTFDENVQAGSSAFSIWNADGTLVEEIAANDAGQVTFTGNTVTIDPAADLAAGSDYYVTVEDNAVMDMAGNGYVGFSDSTTLSFSTEGGDSEIQLAAGTVGTVEATVEADVFTFDAAAALALQDGNTTIEIADFEVAADSLQLDIQTAVGATTLDQLDGVDGIFLQFDPFAKATLINFGNDFNGDVVSITLAGVTDSSLVAVEAI